MADKTVTVTITGPEEVMDPAIDSFVRQYGWTEEVDGVPTTETKEERARAILRGFMIDVIKAYNIKQAELFVRETATTQSDQALDATTMTLVIE